MDSQKRNRRPNVLLMIADDHRYSAIRANGDPVVQTPILDRLIAEGIVFDRNYHFGGLTGAVCVPARACLMTGKNPFRALASKDLDDRAGLLTIDPALPTLPELFRQAGYTTYHIGKWHNDTKSFARSFTGGAKIFLGGMSDHYRVPVHDFDPSGEYPRSARYDGDRHSTELFGEAAIRFLRGHDVERPFFLYLAFTAPHDPRTPPPEYARRYDPRHIPLPENFLPEHPFDNGDLRVRDEALAQWPRVPEEIRQHIADYYGMITHLDAWIGHVLDALEATGQADNTIVVYTADHGLAVGQHGLLGKQNLYEHSVRVPSIMRGPAAGARGGGLRSLPADKRVDALTYTPDLFPTLCDLAGIAIPDSVEARSLVPLLTGAEPRIRDTVFAVYKDMQRMVCDGRWKLIRYYRSTHAAPPNPAVPTTPAAGAETGTDRVQLFDLAHDPWELHDLVDDTLQRGHLHRLAGELTGWQQRTGDPMAGVPALPDIAKL